MYATALLIGALIDKPLLKIILGPGFPPMAHTGWLKISRNFGLFFAFMGVLNEIMWRSFSEHTWVTYDVVGRGRADRRVHGEPIYGHLQIYGG